MNDIEQTLSEISSKFETIDFGERLGNKEGRRISETNYITICSEEIISKLRKYDICIENGFIYLNNCLRPINYWYFKRFLRDASLAMGVPSITASYFRFTDRLLKKIIKCVTPTNQHN